MFLAANYLYRTYEKVLQICIIKAEMYEKMEQLDGIVRCKSKKWNFLGEWNVQKYVHCSKLLTLDRDK